MFDLDEFVVGCRAALAETQPRPALKEHMERTLSRSREITAALGEPSGADLTVLHSAPDVTVLHAVWAPGMSFLPHNHEMLAVIGIYGGQEDNVFWRRGGPGLIKHGGREVRDGEVAVLGPDIIHSVSNPRRAYTAALHVYAGDYLAAKRSEWDPETLEERPFDYESARRRFAEADAAWRQSMAEAEAGA
jgi:predicted metal-dependent enzyme (double-stranded beta helix superfamily)